ncbi:AAA family ATPase [Pseudoalteromonas sp. APC 3358]|uniref:AAA family ATPase n=1 Tax=Pseudoalteromonas sp. APC 3358 TaxID=3035176 RepID=UPI0025B2D594|nr:AAA family ATPase [Pseudoalteromonas sp. APC 3358]MDN3381683.1 AAA family ATPase [Pseudoalteromonas sp. APC 3358]
MITSIKLMDVASYSPTTPVIVNTDNKKVNLFYGLNGSGKSTLGNFLQSKTDPVYQHCEISPSNVEHEIIVYNQNFVRDNFYEIPQQKGIFTLSEANKDAEEAIEKAEYAIKKLEDSQSEIEINANKKNKEITNEESTLKEAVWKSKSKYERTELEFCLAGFKTKDKFLQKIKDSQSSCDSTIKDLKAEAKELNEQDGTPRESIQTISFSGSYIENEQIFKSRIVGSEDSYLAELVEKLGNSDWVQSGMKYLNDDEPCPFCQQELEADFSTAINQLFDTTYQSKKEEILNLKNVYENSISILESNLVNGAFLAEYVVDNSEFSTTKLLLLTCLKDNLSLINDKYTKPSEVIKLLDTTELIDNLNNVIMKIQSEVDTFNDKIKNKNIHLTNINRKFWSLLNLEYAALIEATIDKTKSLNLEVEQLRENYKNKNKDKREQDNIIIENSKKITNIDLSIKNINSQLKELGLQGFQLEKASEDSQHYKIVRESEADEDVYNTLSEGEKTLITFLYFLESCAGATDQESTVILNRRIIVIDDPISSLSHNYIYDIATLIHHKVLLANFKQIFILTHNLFFFHELLMLKAPSNRAVPYKLHRITKSDFSKVKDLQRNEIQNDYQTYWQIIKDCSESHSYANMLPNAMRNILEHYFTFIHKKDALKKTLEDLGKTSSEFKPLFRYINRESHSDSININDFEGIDVEKYIEKFKQVFENTGYSDHYYQMMGIDNPATLIEEETVEV